MFEMKQIAEPVIVLIELAGFSVIVFGMAVSAIRVGGKRLTNKLTWDEAYFRLRRSSGRSLVLGLELLVAAEIIRSISAETLDSVLLLAAIVIIRTFLSIMLEMETEGHWPWQRHDRESDGRERAGGEESDEPS